MFAVFVSGSGVDGFYSILAVSGFTVLPGWGRLLLSFCRVRGSGVRRRSSGVSGNGAFGCLMVIQDVPRFFFQINPGCGSEGCSRGPDACFFRFQPCRFPFLASRLHFVRRT